MPNHDRRAPLWQRLRGGVLRALGVPQGAGILISPWLRTRLLVAVVISVILAGLDILAVLSVLPLMQLLAGGTVDESLATALKTLFGATSPSALALTLGVIMTALFLVRSVATVWFRWWLTGVTAREQIATAGVLYSAYLRAPIAWSSQRSTGDLMTTIGDRLGKTYGLVIMGVLSVLADLISILAMAVTLAVMMPLATVAVGLFFVLVAVLFQRWSRPHILRQSARNIRAATATFLAGTEGLAARKDIQLHGGAAHFEARFHDARSASAHSARVTAFFAELPRHVLEVSFVGAVALMAGITLARPNAADAVSMLAVFAAAGFRVLPSLVRVLAALTGIRSGAPAVADVIRDLKAATSLPLLRQGSGEPLPFTRLLEVDGVTHRYRSAERAAVEDVRLAIPFGSSLALVGASGAGKTTLVDLVLGMAEPEAGRVTVDGVDIAERTPEWHRSVGVVPQSIVFVTGTIRENIAFALAPEEIDEERVARAVDGAGLAPVLAALPDGLDTELVHGSVRLSGGQRQRIGIARALYREPALLVFDEATSALDNATEHRVTETLSALHGKVTLLVVAHRLSTVRHCDAVAFMEEGRVVAVGTFDELRSSCAGFAALVELGRLD